MLFRFSYSRSAGLFVGFSLEGTIISSRPSANEKFYNKKVTPQEILEGKVAPPPNEDYNQLLQILQQKFSSELF